MKINYALISRSLIALVFVVAGIGKIMNFTFMAGYIGSLLGTTNTAVTGTLTVLAILVEVPVALAFAWGYRVCATGIMLMAFTLVATVLAHHNLADQMTQMMALKNIAIIGGILAAVMACECGDGKCAGGKMKGDK
jgi:putative oxidoreductase